MGAQVHWCKFHPYSPQWGWVWGGTAAACRRRCWVISYRAELCFMFTWRHVRLHRATYQLSPPPSGVSGGLKKKKKADRWALFSSSWGKNHEKLHWFRQRWKRIVDWIGYQTVFGVLYLFSHYHNNYRPTTVLQGGGNSWSALPSRLYAYSKNQFYTMERTL